MEGIIKPNNSTAFENESSVGKSAFRMNEQITNPQVRLILTNGENVGIISIKEALFKAQEEGLDLIEIAPNAEVPVCKILDAGKYRYEMQKR